jgi:hypothetical protein
VDGAGNEVPWAAIGAFMAGFGSMLSGLAAYKLAQRKENNESKRATRSGPDK